MKKIFFSIFILITLIMTFSSDVFAAAGLPGSDLEITSDVLDSFDPLVTEGSPYAAELSTPGGIISRALQFIFPISGLILFIMIVVGGLQILAGASDSKSLQEGQKRVTMAVVGFLILFASYWIAQILEVVFGVTIL